MLDLRLGPLQPEGYLVQRSGIRWLVEDGHACAAGEVIAFCNIFVRPVEAGRPALFPNESDDLHVAFATPVAGTLRKADHSSQGGILDKLQFSLLWTPDFVLGRIETAAPAADQDAVLFMLAGRRKFHFGDGRFGLLNGAFELTRGWWGDGPRGTLLGLGICDQAGVIRGERAAFFEIFAQAPGPAHVIFNGNEPVVASARINFEAFDRTPDQHRAIAADMTEGLMRSEVTPTAQDLAFASALLGSLDHSPLRETYDIVTRAGVEHVGPPDAVLLSVAAEGPMVLRHRRLGYHLRIHNFHFYKAGPAMMAWMRDAFEPVALTIDAIRADYDTLMDRLEPLGMTVAILNAMSTTGQERLYSYSAFDRPMSQTLNTLRLKELNLMVHDLARERGVALVDLDAIAVELGGRAHLPDGIHQSGLMESEVRGELLHVLRSRGVTGF